MNKNKISICGRKITTLPTPAITPSAIKLASMPFGRVDITQSPRPAASPSIASIIGVAQAKTA